MKTIHRLLEPGEVRLITDEYLDLSFNWKPLSENRTFRTGETQAGHHHPTRRLETVLLETELSRDQFAAQALEGLCAQTDTIKRAMQMTPGTGEVDITDLTAALAYRFADSMIAERGRQ